jgi:hypothetical protein
MRNDETIARIRRKYQLVAPEMDERRRRQGAAAAAGELGGGGISLGARATGLSRPTIPAGWREWEQPAPQRAAEAARVRRPGGGRKSLVETDPGWLAALESLVEPVTRGDPASPWRWTCKSTRRLAEARTRRGPRVGPRTGAARLQGAGSSRQAHRKTRAGLAPPDRNAPFEDSNARVARFVSRDQPAIAVDTQQKERVGDFKNGGRVGRPRGEPEEVRGHDFRDQARGQAIPSGVSDVVNNHGGVSVGIGHDTAPCATNSIRRWWSEMGPVRFPKAQKLLIPADGGGSNGDRTRLWKGSLQALADERALTRDVGHFPPGTSQWNTIEPRLFSFISQHWRGRPRVSHQAIVSLIAGTTTSAGLIVKAARDTNHYDTEIKVSDQELAKRRLQRPEFHGDWNYTISPRRK